MANNNLWWYLAFGIPYSVSLYGDTAPESDVTETIPAAIGQNYIDRQAYLQNPYIGMPSGGGTQDIIESQFNADSSARKLFSDGSWNIMGAASYVDQNGTNNYGYGVNIFAQTGQLAGFSLGGLMTIMNPAFSDQINPANPEQQTQTLPVHYQVTPQELFAEYQYDHIFQADVGYIGINNSPWMTNYQNNALNLVTYQGLIVNINPGSGWLLTGFATNGAQLISENGFSQQTRYNQSFNNETATSDIAAKSSNGTMALGANWVSPSEQLNARLWGYSFGGYSNLIYADSTLKLPVNDSLGFSIAAQGATQMNNSSGENILNSSGYGENVQSDMLGLQLVFNYSIFELQLAYNNIWGPSNSYDTGNLISPYTYQMGSDPLYTTGWRDGMIEKSAGQAYKIAPEFNLLEHNLIITPSYQYYATTGVLPTAEYDLQLSYNIPEIKGLTLFGGYGYIETPEAPDTNNYQAQLMVSYIY